MSNNQGIMHLATTKGGKPACGKRNAHMSTTVDSFRTWSRQCVKCAAQLAKWDARRNQRTADAFNASGVFKPFICIGGTRS